MWCGVTGAWAQPCLLSAVWQQWCSVLCVNSTQQQDYHYHASHLDSNTRHSLTMGNSRSSLQLQPEDIMAIQEETGFNQNQIERLYSR